MKLRLFALSLFLLFTFSCRKDVSDMCDKNFQPLPSGNISTIAFGSCSNPTNTVEIWKTVAALNPDLYIFLGDNMYGDTENMSLLYRKYGKLSCDAGFQSLINSTPVLATWDDHDYGKNDAGLDYPKKKESKDIFLDFWAEPALSVRRNHEGIYTSYHFGDSAHIVQIILLDNRTFRTPLKTDNSDNYMEQYGPEHTMLGADQWNWLKGELQKPAKIRIIGSSTQFATEHNGWEAWANFPDEQTKMYQIINEAQANGVFFISGDVHYGELSIRNPGNGYPIYDLTSSGLTHNDTPTINMYRQGNAFSEKNFGLIIIDWTKPDTEILLQLFDINGNSRFQHVISLSELHF